MCFFDSAERFWTRKIKPAAGDEDIGALFGKSFAVANPIPSVPSVVTAVLPSSFLDIVSVLCCWRNWCPAGAEPKGCEPFRDTQAQRHPG
jgi:hypothetical protein